MHPLELTHLFCCERDFKASLSGDNEAEIIQAFNSTSRGGRVVRWCWVNFQCRGVLQLGLQ